MDRRPKPLGPWLGWSLIGLPVLIVIVLVSKPQTWTAASPTPTTVPRQAAPLPTPSLRPWSEQERSRLRLACFNELARELNRDGGTYDPSACVCLVDTVERHFAPDEWAIVATRYRLNREPLPAAFVDDYAVRCRRGLIP